MSISKRFSDIFIKAEQEGLKVAASSTVQDNSVIKSLSDRDLMMAIWNKLDVIQNQLNSLEEKVSKKL